MIIGLFKIPSLVLLYQYRAVSFENENDCPSDRDAILSTVLEDIESYRLNLNEQNVDDHYSSLICRYLYDLNDLADILGFIGYNIYKIDHNGVTIIKGDSLD